MIDKQTKTIKSLEKNFLAFILRMYKNNILSKAKVSTLCNFYSHNMSVSELISIFRANSRFINMCKPFIIEYIKYSYLVLEDILAKYKINNKDLFLAIQERHGIELKSNNCSLNDKVEIIYQVYLRYQSVVLIHEFCERLLYYLVWFEMLSEITGKKTCIVSLYNEHKNFIVSKKNIIF